MVTNLSFHKEGRIYASHCIYPPAAVYRVFGPYPYPPTRDLPQNALDGKWGRWVTNGVGIMVRIGEVKADD